MIAIIGMLKKRDKSDNLIGSPTPSTLLASLALGGKFGPLHISGQS